MKNRKGRVLAAIAVGMFSSRASAVVLTVTSLNDTGPGTLRQQITDAAPGDSIVFGVSGVISLASGELTVYSSLTITGPGASYLTLAGNGSTRIFNLFTTNAAATISGLTITGGRVQGAAGADGTAGYGGGAGVSAVGGAILNVGQLTLIECVLAGNSVSGGRGGNGGITESTGADGGTGGNAYGGAIYSVGPLRILRCSLSRNVAQGGDGGAGGNGLNYGGNGAPGGFGGGGAIYSQSGCTSSPADCDAQFVNCTISSNSAAGGAGGPGGAGTTGGGNGGAGGNSFGGGVFDYSSFSTYHLGVINCTVAGNLVSGGNGGGAGSGDTPGSVGLIGPASGGGFILGGVNPEVFLNTLIAGNNYAPGPAGSVGGPDVYGTLSSQGHNLVGKREGGIGWDVTDLLGTIATPIDPKIGPLQANGGQTLTHALLSGSPAIDGGDDAVLSASYSLTSDQRGRARRSGTHVDIGAYEFGAVTNLLVTNNLDSGPNSVRDVLGQSGDGDSVNFAPNVTGTIPVNAGAGGEGLTINHSISINGPGAGALAVSGVGGRVFHVLGGNVTICGLMIVNGNASNGGGIYNEGTLTLCDCYLGNNTVTVGGGAIYNKYYATLTVLRCCLAANHADYGGAIYSDVGAYAFCINSTFSGNASGHWGGAIANYGGLVNLDSCTVAANTASSGTGGGGLFTDYDGAWPSSVRNCLLAANSAAGGPDSYGPVDSGGYNLVSRADNFTDGFYGPGDRVGSMATPLDARLGPLQSNGGPTPTMALLAGSPATDAGKSFGQTTDQRGGRRPVDEPGVANVSGGDGTDIGAYERDGLLAIQTGLSVPTNGPPAIVLCFPAEDGNTYQVQYTSDPAANNWLDLGAPVQGHGLTECVQDGDVSAPQRFYRIVLR
jgi:hypothetical protein